MRSSSSTASNLPEPERREVYVHDLIGLDVVTRDGTQFGKVSRMPNYGAGDLLEIARSTARRNSAHSLLRCLCAEVDLAEGQLIVDLPEGYLDRATTMSFAATILTLFPEMFPGPLGVSLAGKALTGGLWSLDIRDIRDSATDRHRTVDDTPAGGGPGMVMKPDMLAAAIDARRR